MVMLVDNFEELNKEKELIYSDFELQVLILKSFNFKNDFIISNNCDMEKERKRLINIRKKLFINYPFLSDSHSFFKFISKAKIQYSQSEINFLYKFYGVLTIKEMGLCLNRNISGIRNKLKNIII